MPVAPITPGQAAKGVHIPDAVIEAFNTLIAENFDGCQAVVKQADVVARIEAAGISSSVQYERGYLNVEGRFRDAGWGVEYDKPCYDDRYGAFYSFTAKNTRSR